MRRERLTSAREGLTARKGVDNAGNRMAIIDEGEKEDGRDRRQWSRQKEMQKTRQRILRYNYLRGKKQNAAITERSESILN